MDRLIREGNFTPANLRKLRQYAGVRTTQQLINTAGREIDLGVRPATQRRRALNYWREQHNNAVEQVREANRIARNEARRANAAYAVRERPIDQINAFRSSAYTATRRNRNISRRGLYNTIKRALGESPQETGYAVLTYIDRRNQRPTNITVNPNYLDTYEEFEARIGEIAAQGGTVGSGVIGDENYDLLLDRFVLRFVTTEANGNGRFLFEIEGMTGDEDASCVKKCLEKMGYDLSGEKYYSVPHEAKEVEWNDEIYKWKVVNKKDSRYYKQTYITTPWEDEKTGMLGKANGLICEYEVVNSYESAMEFLEREGACVDVIGNTFSIRDDSDWKKRPGFLIPDPTQSRNVGGRKETVDGKEMIKGAAKQIKLTKLLDTDIIPFDITPTELKKKLNDYDAKDFKLIYCAESRHLDIIKCEERVWGKIDPKLDDIYIARDMRIFQQVPTDDGTGDIEYKFLFKPSQIHKSKNYTNQTEAVTYVLFDYETIIDWEDGCVMKPYSLSAFFIQYPERVSPITNKVYGDRCSSLIKHFAHELIENGECEAIKSYVGWDCTEQFARDILENQHKKIYQFVSFNGTNFDNIILMKDLLELNQKPEYKERLNVSDIFYNGNQLINFKLNGRHNTFDVKKYLNGSLADNCKAFSIPEEYCKKGFNHDEVQHLYDTGKLDLLLKDPKSDFYKKLVDYNNFDVISLALIHISFKTALGEIECVKKYIGSLERDFKTIGSLIYRIFTDHIKEEHIYLPYIPHDLYADMQKYKVAGRVELFNGFDKIEECIASADECSAYPYEMAVAPNWFPVGIKEVRQNERDKIEEKEIGAGNYKRSSEWVEPPDANSKQNDDTNFAWYYCTFNQKVLGEKNLPNIYPEKIFDTNGTTLKNNWETRNDLVDYFISNVVIKRLRDHGVRVDINQEKLGIVFQAKKKNISLFRPILDFMQGKNKQDVMKKENSPDYNGALREMYKLLMNSLSGKVIENLHTEKTQEIDLYKYLTLKHKVDEGHLKSINAINIVADKVFATTEDYEEKLIKQQRPIYLAVLIYAYTHRSMSNHLYDKIGLKKMIYADTDSGKCRYTHFEEWTKWAMTQPVPHWKEVEKYDPRYKTHMLYSPDSKVFGSFENELDTENDLGVFLAKKQYLISKQDPTDYHPHMSFKGVSGRDIMLDLDSDFVDKHITRHRDGRETVSYQINDNKKAYYYARDNQHLTISNNYNKLFEQIYAGGEAQVLCSSFNKNIKNSARNVGIDDTEKFNSLQNTISSRQLIKTVRIQQE